MKWPVRILIWVIGTALLSLFITVMVMVIYPNSLKAAAPLLCPDDRPDAFVVRYDVQTSDGSGTNFTLFCMSERGEFFEVGTWQPLLVLFGLVSAGLFGGVLLYAAANLIRGGSRRGPPDSGIPGGPPPGPDPFEAMLANQPNPIVD